MPYWDGGLYDAADEDVAINHPKYGRFLDDFLALVI